MNTEPADIPLSLPETVSPTMPPEPIAPVNPVAEADVTTSQSEIATATDSRPSEPIAPDAVLSSTEVDPVQPILNSSNPQTITEQTIEETTEAPVIVEPTKSNDSEPKPDVVIAQPGEEIPVAAALSESEPEIVSEAEPTPLEPEFDRAAIVASALQSEQTSWQSDYQSLQTYQTEAQSWVQAGQALRDRVLSIVPQSSKILEQSRQAFAALPPELQEVLQTRAEGLEIIGRMLERLPGQAEDLGAEVASIALPDLPADMALQDLIATETDANTATQQLHRTLKPLSNQRWQNVSAMRDTAQQRRKQVLQFLEKRILPILDGIDSGEKYSHPLVQTKQEEFPEIANALAHWLAVYDSLRSSLMQLLHETGVSPMQVQIGAPIDYDRHEPIDVEPDETLKTEDVKEVTRQGYEYTLPTGEQLVLRCAEVVVVKN